MGQVFPPVREYLLQVFEENRPRFDPLYAVVEPVNDGHVLAVLCEVMFVDASRAVIIVVFQYGVYDLIPVWFRHLSFPLFTLPEVSFDTESEKKGSWLFFSLLSRWG